MNKREVTEAVIAELKLEIKLDLALKSWWWPDYGINHQNNRLTKPGVGFMCAALKGHTFDFDFNNTGAELKRLTQMDTPFYVERESITIFSPKLAVMIQLYADFGRYMDLYYPE